MKTPNELIGKHYTDYFGRSHTVFEMDPPSAVTDRVPGLRMLEVTAGKKVDIVSYLTLGCWEAVQSLGIGCEFVLAAREADAVHLVSLATAAIAHCGHPDQRLDRGSVVQLDGPWLPGSECDRLLVTLPYPYGPELEYCRWKFRGNNYAARVLWLMPITAGEGAMVALDGIEALEKRFEEVGVNYADPGRHSAV